MIDLLPNETIVFQWVIFMIAVVTLHFLVFRPTLRILDQRKSKTAGEKETAQKLQHQSQEIMSLCEKRIEEARLQGVRLKEEIRSGGEKFMEDLLKKTRKQIEETMEESRQNIDRSAKEIAMQLRQQARDLGREIAVKILEREV